VNQLGDGVNFHLLHDATAVDFDGCLRDAEGVSDLLVEVA
jgi:hypothetical protein